MSEYSSTLAVLLKRLEAATTKLEGLALERTQSNATTTSAQPLEAKDDVKSIAIETEEPEFVQVFESELKPVVETFNNHATSIGGLVATQGQLVVELADLQKQFLRIAARAKKPTAQDMLAEIWKPLQTVLDKIMQLTEQGRGEETFNHLSTVSAGIPAFSWVVVEPDTAINVKEFMESAQYYANRVIKNFKESDPKHVQFSQSFMNLLKKLYEYVHKYHKTGLTWNPKGIEANQVKLDDSINSSSSSQRPTPPPKPASLKPTVSSTSVKQGPPPPPPAPLLSTLLGDNSSDETKTNNQTSMGSVFNEINQGADITKGLKKVDPSMMTHKNPELRLKESSTTSAPVKPPARSTARPVGNKTNQQPIKEPETKLEGNKWFVQYYTTGHIKVEPNELKQIVYIFNCNNATIEIVGKCNGVVLDTCKKTGVVLDTAMASVDIVNSSSCQIQILNSTPTIVIDKTDGLQVYLSKNCLDAEVLTAKSSQINLLLPPNEEKEADEDFVERAIPEQFKSKIVNGKVVTVPMEHE